MCLWTAFRVCRAPYQLLHPHTTLVGVIMFYKDKQQTPGAEGLSAAGLENEQPMHDHFGHRSMERANLSSASSLSYKKRPGASQGHPCPRIGAQRESGPGPPRARGEVACSSNSTEALTAGLVHSTGAIQRCTWEDFISNASKHLFLSFLSHPYCFQSTEGRSEGGAVSMHHMGGLQLPGHRTAVTPQLARAWYPLP